MAAVTICSDFGTQKIKSATVSTVFPSISEEVMGPDAMILVFYFCFIDYAKAFDCVDHNKLWKILKSMGKQWKQWQTLLLGAPKSL